jgi:hypothetical protein
MNGGGQGVRMCVGSGSGWGGVWGPAALTLVPADQHVLPVLVPAAPLDDHRGVGGALVAVACRGASQPQA